MKLLTDVLLLCNAIDAERHGGQLVVDDTLLFVRFNSYCTLLRCNELRTLDAVLVVHTRMAQGDGLGRWQTR